MARGLVIAFLLVLSAGCGTGEEPGEPAARGAEAARSAAASPEVEVRVSGGGQASAKRRVAEGCEPGAEARRYADLVDGRALAKLRWTGLDEQAADLRIPVYVVAIEEDAVGVRFLQFPMREEYLNVWLGSGHIRAGAEDTFLLDPCSATLEPQP